ncbi:transformer-2 protein homolog beta-like [Babylonia areolata]|uniref:transformer-2 protein homolog beta-like n=1 Tax=Babylonia areolata TaxID=304850 RepID=UPI003FD66A17
MVLCPWSPCRRREYEHERQEHERRTDEQRPSCCNGRNGSPVGSRKQYLGDRENPVPNRCIGVFGLSLYTQEKGLWEVFGRCGQISEVQVVYDRQTGRSRGFAFVYFRSTDDAYEAKYRCDGMEIDGRKIRVDFSITGGPHPPTPGVYLGRPCDSSRRSPDRRPSSYQRSVSPYSCGYRHSCPQDRKYY